MEGPKSPPGQLRSSNAESFLPAVPMTMSITSTTQNLIEGHQKRKIDEKHVEGHEELDAANLREHEEFTKVKNIAKIEPGVYEIDTWYFSPFPPEYNDCFMLYFCEFCLNFMKRKEQLQRHEKM
ncbi:putative MYST-like histone acetyltransferase 1 [Dendrobium catenatum]|uniref:Histone acetyltransferase n=1 Tax=Dendrobium catenatum TaxID=906689 RepID=A0A2I0VGJ4_9ASPA|nr:putative MYST-like histone acetyltransferase 1 [Dendrobium catenatum]